MVDRAVFSAAHRALGFAFERQTSLCDPFLAVIPADGCAVSILGRGQSTVSASDSTAAWLDELQFDLGEGPCWDAMGNNQPVITPAVGYDAHRAWPGFTEALLGGTASVASIFAFPLVFGSLEIGAVDLYTAMPSTLTPGQVAAGSALAQVATWQVLRRLLARKDFEDAETPAARREVHQATGMILVQLGISADDARLVLRARSYASGRPVAEVARDVVSRSLDFSDHGDSKLDA